MHPAPRAVAAPHWSHYPVLRTGVAVGTGLCVLSLAWLLLANRVPFLDSFALARNVIAAAAAGVLLLIPACRFLRSPSRLFLSGLIAWTMLALAYGVMEVRFPALEERMGSFHLFMLGSAAYGLLASLVWVTRLIVSVRQHPIAARR